LFSISCLEHVPCNEAIDLFLKTGMYGSPLTYDWSVAMILEAFVTPMVIPPLIFVEKFVIHLTLI
jgi:hypothetical protein